MLPKEIKNLHHSFKSNPSRIKPCSFFRERGHNRPLKTGCSAECATARAGRPFSAPKRSTASSPYCEQVGMYLQQPRVPAGRASGKAGSGRSGYFFGANRFMSASPKPFFRLRPVFGKKQARRVPPARLSFSVRTVPQCMNGVFPRDTSTISTPGRMAGTACARFRAAACGRRFRLTALPIFLLAVMPMRGAAPPRFMQ